MSWTRFASTAVGAIAYQVVGRGRVTVLAAKPHFFPIDLMWEELAFNWATNPTDVVRRTPTSCRFGTVGVWGAASRSPIRS